MKSFTNIKESLEEARNYGNRAYTSDYKLGTDGRIIRAHHIKTGERAPSSIGISAPDVGDENDDQSPVIKREKIEKPKYTKELAALRKAQGLPPIQTEQIELVELATAKTDPPFVLVLKRINIRLFPNDVKVALYHNEKLDKYFSIPYGNHVDSTVQAEETISEERSVLLKMIDAYNGLTEDNREAMLGMLTESEDSYNRVKEFVLRVTNESD